MEYIIYCDESVSDGKYYTDFFDISKTTPIVVPKDFWTMPYRHWKFTTPEFRTEGEGI